jgi:hypothetical protein
MGDEKVLIFSDSGEDVGLAIKKKVWWEGILDKFQPWNPSMVASNREVWVRIFGVPVQLWTEYVFRSILKPWGIVVGLDEETSGRVLLMWLGSKFHLLCSRILISHKLFFHRG